MSTRVKIARLEEAVVRRLLFLCAAICVVATFGIIAVLASEALGFFHEVTLVEFLTGTVWAPMFDPRHFGVLPLVSGTLVITVGAAAIGIPGGLGVALFLNEYAPEWVRNVVKPVMEILAGIPTVVYGYFALTTVTPFLQQVLPVTEVFNAASADSELTPKPRLWPTSRTNGAMVNAAKKP
jgi:phosphate transport system permease protein